MNRRLLLFLALVVASVLVLWLATGRESLLGRRKPPLEVDEPPKYLTTGGESSPDVALREATIPVREELPEFPGQKVLKYRIGIGQSEGGLAKRLRATDVLIEIFNKKPPPEERMIATVRGDRAVLNFMTAPDPTLGMQDAEIESMVLRENVVVEYLEDDGEVATRLDSEELELSNDVFRVPGRAVIRQEGLTVEGDVLVYDKLHDTFSFERNVRVEGTRFGLPEREEDEPRGRDEADAVAEPDPVRTITCSGRFTYVAAAEDDGRDAGPSRDAFDAKGVSSVRGGVLTFRDDVVANQADSTLYGEMLEITLGRSPGEGGGKSGKLEIRQVLATGGPGPDGTPARMVDPRGQIEGGSLLLERRADGDFITMREEPRIRDAMLGGLGGTGEDEADAPDVAAADAPAPTRFSAAARTEIRFRPMPGEFAEGEPRPTVLELRDDAFLETASADPEKDFRIEGQTLDLLFLERKTEAGTDFEMQRLTADGAARGVFAQGTFTGDHVEATPRDTGGEGSTEFEIRISPNPAVELVTDLAEGGGQREVRIRATAPPAVLTYTPAAAEEPTRAVLEGAAELVVREGGAVSTTLTASRRVIMESAPAAEGDTEGGPGLASLIAEGDVRLDSPAQRVVGSGDRMELLPSADGSQRLRLSGLPATATQTDEDGREKNITGHDIEFDPATGALHARGAVVARGAGLSLAGAALGADDESDISEAGGVPGDASAAPPQEGVLRCEELWVSQPEGEDGGKALKLIAQGRVDLDEPGRGLRATAHHLDFDDRSRLAVLDGVPGAPASVTRFDTTVPAGTLPRQVAVSGPRVILELEIDVLTCPTGGQVRAYKPGPEGLDEGAQAVAARAAGPVRYVDDQLLLRDDVVFTFERWNEDDEVLREERALWCDRGTVYLAPSEDGDEGAGVGSPDRVVAEGRVHLEQRLPRELVAEGSELEWSTVGEDETMVLSGVNPRCWVAGLLGDRNMRLDADRVHLSRNAQEFEAENGLLNWVDLVERRNQ